MGDDLKAGSENGANEVPVPVSDPEGAGESGPAPEPALRTARGTSVPRVMGILSIILGSLMSCSGAGGTGVPSPFGSDDGDVAADDVSRNRPNTSARAEVRPGVIDRMWSTADLATSIVLIVLGVGQLRYRRWACRATVVWGVIAIALALVAAVRTGLVMGPAMDRASRELRVCRAVPSDAGGADTVMDCEPVEGTVGGSGFAFGMAFMMALLLSAYPTVLIVMFRRPRVVAAMRE